MKYALVVLAACAPAWKSTPHDRLFQAEAIELHRAPPVRERFGDWWEHGHDGFVRPLARLVSPARYASAIVGGRRAYDVNAFGQVPDSAWFENRIGKRDVTADELARQGGTLPDGPLLVIDGKTAGASAGFVVTDAAGTRWYVKFDPPAHPTLSTSAEVIAARLLWLAGYHVPEMHVTDVRVDRFVLAPGATTRNDYNCRVVLTRERLDQLFVLLNPDREGRVRALFSREPPGTVLGSFSYRDTEADDPADRFPHEHRRTLRGLRVFFAWVGNTDARGSNTLDVFEPRGADGRGRVVHYLIDLGDAFGSAGTHEKAMSQSWQNLVDWGRITGDFLTLGFRYPRWLGARRSAYRSVGPFESELFDYAAWEPDLPNPAFAEATSEDELWAASILARTQPEHIGAAVAAGKYLEPGAADYVTRILIERRRKILTKLLARNVALDRPRVSSDGRAIELDDLRAFGGLTAIPALHYEVRWNRTRRGDVVLDRGTTTQPRIELTAALAKFSGHADPFLTIHLTPVNDRRSLDIHVRVTPDGRIIPVALDR